MNIIKYPKGRRILCSCDAILEYFKTDIVSTYRQIDFENSFTYLKEEDYIYYYITCPLCGKKMEASKWQG